MIKSMHTDQFNHAPAQIFMNTGFAQPGRPSLGSWVLYGLGAETSSLPAYVVMSTGAGISGGPANWSSGFMPTIYSGCRFRNQGDPILDTSSPAGVDAKLQRDSLDLVGALNQRRLASDGDPEIATRIASYELAFRLQTSAPGADGSQARARRPWISMAAHPDKPTFARACLLARRMIERGVRFVNIYHEGWDAHSDVTGNHKDNCQKTDQASAALVMDLKRRGLLDDTLVIWGGEFGRTPMVESNAALGRSLGRDHHPTAFTMWMAGGGLKRGYSLRQAPMTSASTSRRTRSMSTTCRPPSCICSASTMNASPTTMPAATSASPTSTAPVVKELLCLTKAMAGKSPTLPHQWIRAMVFSSLAISPCALCRLLLFVLPVTTLGQADCFRDQDHMPPLKLGEHALIIDHGGHRKGSRGWG
jgi:hypothetical protein